ncbi:urea transporter [Labilibaculum euxinus]|uniref:Peptidoglycan DD-metalloendopeptidase family protein n=1 Tax=Labilibaculum euxinus TaxID=2686357 RepID=A0A7M4DBI2_9BACT|nr:urea transporter [Labilibaculum euxinus]MUP40011.1 peptidoglycan DD-metalloendopeptidase family protein [Labilibaculum euxinus]MVB09216.1 peptidoglycan DD-metalloendopeptidase family protein [Labilibaculum euxinus]
MKELKQNILFLGEATLNSYAQVFFSRNKAFAVLLLVVSFFDPWAGTAGLISILTANLVAGKMGFSSYYIKDGSYGFNSLLVGLGIGLYFQPGLEITVLVILSSILTLFICLFLQGVLAKYALPFLSVPFLLGIWMIMLASSDLTSLGISERGIYQANEIFSLGGQKLVNVYHFIQNWEIHESVSIFLKSLGAIFFQSNWLAGLLILIGLLFYSRIAFTFAILGFYIAYFFYILIDVNISGLGYTFIGFNFILTSIALGAFYLIPSPYSYLWIILLLPIVVLTTLSSVHWFAPYRLSVYALPFNAVTLLFLYILKLRYQPSEKLQEVQVQHNSPEKNLYYFKSNTQRLSANVFTDFQLPFIGEWSVSQAHEGEYTHKNEWRHAWDFVILNDEDEQYKNDGDFVEDYYCYNKTILCPADGEIVNILDGIPDNKIGQVNLNQNWGNSLVIRHNHSLFSQLSHFKENSFKVKKGDLVKKGEVLGLCGNSGRSPYPHLHFQFQATPYIGSATLDVTLSHYIERLDKNVILKSYTKPTTNTKLLRGEIHPLLSQALGFQTGQKFTLTVESGLDSKLIILEKNWDFKVKSDAIGNTYIQCLQTNSKAFFSVEANVLQFHNYLGNKRSLLYYLYLSCYKVYLGYYQDLNVTAEIPPNQVFRARKLFLQDFIAPFYIYLQSNYQLKYQNKKEGINSEKIELSSKIECGYSTKREHLTSEIKVEDGASLQIKIIRNGKLIEIKCGNMQAY